MTLLKLPRPPRWLEYILLVLILLAALGLRVYHLSELPYGPYYDEAANVILAGEIASGQYWPIFIEPYTGKEVLFFYLAAGLMRLIGVSTFALRLTAALAGWFSVLMAYKLARELFADEPLVEGRWLALLAAALMAVSFWPVVVSRYGFRANTLPLTQAVMLWALWRSLGRPGWGWTALAGVWCGLTAYTYLSSRALPLALLIIWLVILSADRARLRRRLFQLIVFGLAALAVFAPLGWFFYTHPQTFTVRMSQIFAAGDSASLTPDVILKSSWRALEMFTVRGDPLARFGIPERPVFPGAAGWLFYVGVLAALARLFVRNDWRGRVRYGLLIIWPLVMLLPTILTVPHEIPHSLRAIGVIPLIYILAALGGVLVLSALFTIWRRANANLHEPRQSAPSVKTRVLLALAASVVAVLGAGGAATYNDYFVRWAAMPGAYYDQDGDMADMVRYLNSRDLSHAQVYASTFHYRHPTAAALARDYERIKWVTGAYTLVWPQLPPGQTALFAFPHAAMPEADWLARYFPPESLAARLDGPDGRPAFLAYELRAAPVISPQHPVNVTFGGVIELLGYDVLRAAPSGQKADIALYWRVLRQPDWGDYQFFATLTDAWGIELAKHSSFSYPSEQWAPGEVIVDWWRVPTPVGTPPGDCVLKVGVWSPEKNKRLTATDAQGRFAGTVARLSPIPVGPPQRVFNPEDVEIAHRLNVRLGELNLLGYVQWPETVRQGDTLFVGLYWQAAQTPSGDYKVRLSLRRGDVGVILYDNAPVHGALSTTQWRPGQIVADLGGLRLPSDIPPGRYTLEAGMTNADGNAIGPAQALGDVIIEATQRSFDVPPIARPLNVRLGGQVELLGYALNDAAAARPGQTLRLSLYWQALAPMDANYTVFVQLLDASGALRAQQDNPPVHGTYPTTLWVSGEVVTDEYALELPPDLPAGAYTLIAGWYEPETGARLPVRDTDRVVLGTVEIAP